MQTKRLKTDPPLICARWYRCGVLANENNLWELTMEQRAHLILFWMARLEGTDARSEVVNIVDKQRQVLF